VWRANHLAQQNGDERKMRFVFPIENYRELKHHLQVSHFPVLEDIDLVPVSGFHQAFFLGMDNSEIQIEQLEDIAKKRFDDVLKKAKSNTKKWNEKVLTAYKGKL